MSKPSLRLVNFWRLCKSNEKRLVGVNIPMKVLDTRDNLYALFRPLANSFHEIMFRDFEFYSEDYEKKLLLIACFACD
jgi:hypothetical protein